MCGTNSTNYMLKSIHVESEGRETRLLVWLIVYDLEN